MTTARTETVTQILLPGQQAAPEGPVDLMSMYVMHHAFRRDLTAFRAAVEEAPLADLPRWGALHRRWAFFAAALHHHHAGEDAGLWPLLSERASMAGDDEAGAMLDAMQAEHAQIDPLLADCTTGFERLAWAGSETVRGALSQSIEGARDLLDRHLAHEERSAMEVVQRYLTDQDWRRVEREHFRAGVTLKQAWTVVPWSQHGLPAAVRRKVLAAGGLPFKVIWLLGRRSFLRAEEAAFGPVSPPR